MIKRAKFWIPKLRSWLPQHILNSYDVMNLSKEYLRACHAIADIQEHFNLKSIDISNGVIMDYKNGKKFIAKGKLSSIDLMNIAREARNVHYYEGSVRWLIASLQQAKYENKDFGYLKKIR